MTKVFVKVTLKFSALLILMERRITIIVQRKRSTKGIENSETPSSERKMRDMTMLVPRRHRSMLDPFMNDPFDSFFSNMTVPQATPNLMRTDIKENEGGYEIVIDLPGFDKENVAAELKEGVLKVSAKTSGESEENTGTYLRRERFSGQCSRQFYVGDDIEEGDIKAKFDNGTLLISVPKKVEQPKLEEARTISIEG